MSTEPLSLATLVEKFSAFVGIKTAAVSPDLLIGATLLVAILSLLVLAEVVVFMRNVLWTFLRIWVVCLILVTIIRFLVGEETLLEQWELRDFSRTEYAIAVLRSLFRRIIG